MSERDAEAHTASNQRKHLSATNIFRARHPYKRTVSESCSNQRQK